MPPLSVAQGAKQMKELGAEFKTAEGRAVRVAALKAKNIQLRYMKAAAPGMTLRAGKSRKSKLGVNYKLVNEQGRPAALLRARGQAHLIERDTSPHVIPRAAKRKGRKPRKRVVVGGEVYSKVNHPGTKGKHPWEKGAAEVQRTVFVDVFAEIQKGVIKVIG